jgi:CubicO group peptidase (beta-lactamase class C family)
LKTQATINSIDNKPYKSRIAYLVGIDLGNLRTNLIVLFASLVELASCGQSHNRDSNYQYQTPKALKDEISVDYIDKVGLDSNKIIALTKLILADSFANIHSLLIARNNKLVYENYFSGDDQIWGFHLGYATHTIKTLHDLRSISKSVVSACIGIAIMQHKIKSIDEPIFNYLPGYIRYRTAQNSQITIRHLLTMSAGIRWNEDSPHNTSLNDESQMEKSPDPVAYTLSLPMAEKPGLVWNYNSGGVQVLAAILKQVSGFDINLFAEKYLFLPLGIRDYQWIKSQPDFPAAASGLRLKPRDLLKIGLLYMNEGRWNNASVIPASWTAQSLSTQILRKSNDSTKGYGYLFWRDEEIINQHLFNISAAKGNGGQRLFLDKESKLIVVITAGNYNRSGIVKDGELAMEEYILPSLR